MPPVTRAELEEILDKLSPLQQSSAQIQINTINTDSSGRVLDEFIWGKMTAAQPFSLEMKETLPNYSNMEETNKNRDKSALNFIIRRKTKIASQSYPATIQSPPGNQMSLKGLQTAEISKPTSICTA